MSSDWNADKTESIEVGKATDIVILDPNLLTVLVDDISDVQVIATLPGGKPTYDPEAIFH
ncbi:MAG: hypothetical protein WBD13_03640 [Burkholderiaceae bacterium]